MYSLAAKMAKGTVLLFFLPVVYVAGDNKPLLGDDATRSNGRLSPCAIGC